MMGFLRFTLAMFVVTAHLTEGVRFFSHWGVFAVFGFYLISGYLMTLILHETYSFRFSSFVLNRFLRLFPIYYLVAVVSAYLILSVPASADFLSVWEVKYRASDFLGNGLIFPFEFYDASFRIVPSTWSIAVELINYFLLWLVVARSRSLALSTVLLTITYHVVTLAVGMDWSSRYRPFYAALLPFSLGACIYFCRDQLARLSISTIRYVAFGSFLVWVANLILCGVVAGMGGPHFDTFYYWNLVSLLALISCLTTSSLKSLSPRWGKIFGDLAYPAFLTHWIIGFAVSLFVLGGQRRGLALLALSVFPILAVSFALAWSADRWLEPLRDKVRRKVALPATVSSGQSKFERVFRKSFGWLRVSGVDNSD
ncbi:MAG: acyltransferase [Nitrospirota bacterium]